VEKVEQVGVDTVRSRRGIASRAREGETLGQGEEGRRSGELRVLAGGVVARSWEAMAVVAASASLCRDGMGCVTGVEAAGRGGCFGSVTVKLLQVLACLLCFAAVVTDRQSRVAQCS
jgi:hypothetical protein